MDKAVRLFVDESSTVHLFNEAKQKCIQIFSNKIKEYKICPLDLNVIYYRLLHAEALDEGLYDEALDLK